MNYEPVIWQNDQPPALDEDNLNHIEQGIKTASDSINELTTRVDAIPDVQGGRVQMPNVSTGSYGDQPVVFERSFTTIPNVTATIETANTSGNFGNVTVAVNNISTTGFTVRLFNNRGYDASPAVQWIAIRP